MDNLIEAAKSKVRKFLATQPGRVVSQFGSDLNRTLQNIGTGTGAALQTFVSQPLAGIKEGNMMKSQNIASQAMQEKIRQQQGLSSQQNIPYLLNQSRAYSNTPDFTTSNLKLAESNLQKRIGTGTQQTGIKSFMQNAAPATNVLLTGLGGKAIGAMPAIQKATTLGTSALLSGGVGALTGENPFESALAGVLQTPRIVGLTGPSSFLTKYGASGMMDKLATPLSRNIAGRAITGLGNVIEDEFLSKLNNVQPQLGDRVLSFGIGALLAPTKEYEAFIQSGDRNLVKKIKEAVRDLRGRYATEAGIKPKSLDYMVEDPNTRQMVLRSKLDEKIPGVMSDIEKLNKYLEQKTNGFGNVAKSIRDEQGNILPEYKGLTPDNPLLAEARKYKSAEEFADDWGTPISSTVNPGQTLIDAPTKQKPGIYYHGTDPESALKIATSGNLKTKVSDLDKLGENVVSLSGDRGLAQSYGNILFEVNNVKVKPAPSGAIAGNINGKELAGAEYRAYGDIPKSNIKKAMIQLGKQETADTKIFMGYEKNTPVYSTYKEISDKLNESGIKTYIVPYKDFLTDIFNQSRTPEVGGGTLRPGKTPNPDINPAFSYDKNPVAQERFLSADARTKQMMADMKNMKSKYADFEGVPKVVQKAKGLTTEQFNTEALKIRDNLKTGEVGYLKSGDKTYQITKESYRAKLIKPSSPEVTANKGLESTNTPFENPLQTPKQTLQPELPAPTKGLRQTKQESVSRSLGTILPEKGKLNVDRLNLNTKQKQAISEMQTDVPVTVISNKQVVEAAKLRKSTGKKISDQDMVNVMADQLNSRQEVVSLQRQFDKAKKSGALPDELESILKKISDQSRVAQQQRTMAGRLLQSGNILANEFSTPQQRIFALLDNAGVESKSYLKDAVNVDWNNANSVVGFYRKHVPPTLGEVLTEIRYSNMLSSPSTLINNPFSNFIQSGIVAPAEKILKGGIDWVGSKVSGKERQYYASQGIDYAKGWTKSFPNALKAFSKAWKGETPITNLDLDRLPTFSGGALKAYTWPLRMLEAQDQFFRELVKGGVMEEYAGKMKSSQLIKKASEEADYRLFRQTFDPSGELGQGTVLKTWDKWNQKVNALRKLPGGNWIVPFLQTPTNILKQGFEYSPLGFSTAIGAKDPKEQIAKAMLGSIVTLGAYGIANSGKTTWDTPTDPKERELFYAAGMQPYSIKIGDKWISYSKLGPMAYPIAMASAMKWTENNNPDQNVIEDLRDATGQMLGFFGDQSYMKSLGDTIEAIKGGNGNMFGKAMSGQISNFAGQLVPMASLMRWVQRIVDPIYRKPETATERITAGIPGMSTDVQAYQDIYGNDSVRDLPILNAFSPLRVTQEKPLAREMLNLKTQENINKKVIKRQAEKSDSGKQIGGIVGYKNDSGELKTVNFGKVLSLPETNSFEKAIKAKEAYKIVDDIVDADIPEDQKTQIYSQLGIKPQEAKYYRVAKEDNDIKTAYIMDKLGTLKPNDRKSMFEILVKGRLEVNKSKIVSDGVLDNLYEQDLLSKEEVKKLKSLRIDNTGKKPVVKLTGRGKTAKLKKLKYTPLKLKLKPLKKIKDFDVKNLKL